jgi:diacylglycerol kinase (ATP)
MTSFRHSLLIKNPTSGARWAFGLSSDTVRDLREWIPSLDIAATEYRGHGTEMAREAAKSGYDLVIAAGGDGTLNEVLNGVFGTETPVAYIPVGTGNSIAYSLGLPIHAAGAVAALKKGEVRDAYLGLAGGRYFGLMVGIGFDAVAVREVPYPLKRAFGRLSYVLAGSVALLRYRYPTFRVTADGKTYDCTTVIVAKSQYYASRFKIAPETSLEIPDFQLCLFSGSGPLNYLKYAGAVVLNRHTKLPDVRSLKARRVEIKPEMGLLAQMDGDVMPEVPTEIRIAERPVKILFPAKG